MPAISKLSRAEWDEIKDAAIAGVPITQLGERYEIPEGTIYVRAHREKWPIPNRIKAMAAERANEIPNGLKVANVSQCKKEAITMEIAADSLLKNGEEGSLIASQLVLGLLRKASDKPEVLAPLADVYDLTAGLKAIRLAAGMDRADGATVNVSIGGWQASVTAQIADAGWIEAETLGESQDVDNEQE